MKTSGTQAHVLEVCPLRHSQENINSLFLTPLHKGPKKTPSGFSKNGQAPAERAIRGNKE